MTENSVNGFRQIIYEKPVTLKRVLYDICEDEDISDIIPQKKSILLQFLEDLKDTKIAQRKIKKIIGSGASSIAFETPMGDVLKISHKNPFVKNRPVQDFDAQIYKKGKHKKSYYLLEEKLDTINRFEDGNPVLDVINKIKNKGFAICDLSEFQVWQIGRAKNGQFKLLDHECAIFKSSFHRIKTVIQRFLQVD